MKAFILYYILIFSIIYNSLENKKINRSKFKKNNNKKVYFNNKNNILGKDLKLLSKKEETKIYDEVKILNEIDSMVKKITKTYESDLFNLTQRINSIISSTLNTQNEINKKAESEKITIENMLNEMRLLKEDYKKNMNYTYILCGIIFLIFIIFCFIDYLRKDNQPIPIPSGYHKTIEEQNVNNQLSIE